MVDAPDADVRPESLEAILELNEPHRRRRARRRGDARRSPTGSRSPASDETASDALALQRARAARLDRAARLELRRARATWERDGVTAAIVPAARTRSICNSVAYARRRARSRRASTSWPSLREGGDRGLDRLGAGVRPRDDRAARGAPATSSTASPMAMSIELASFEPLDLGDLDWDTRPRPRRPRRASTTSPTGCPTTSGVAAALAAPARAARAAPLPGHASTASPRACSATHRPRRRPRLLLRRHPPRAPRARAGLAADARRPS